MLSKSSEKGAYLVLYAIGLTTVLLSLGYYSITTNFKTLLELELKSITDKAALAGAGQLCSKQFCFDSSFEAAKLILESSKLKSFTGDIDLNPALLDEELLDVQDLSGQTYQLKTGRFFNANDDKLSISIQRGNWHKYDRCSDGCLEGDASCLCVSGCNCDGERLKPEDLKEYSSIYNCDQGSADYPENCFVFSPYEEFYLYGKDDFKIAPLTANAVKIEINVKGLDIPFVDSLGLDVNKSSIALSSVIKEQEEVAPFALHICSLIDYEDITEYKIQPQDQICKADRLFRGKPTSVLPSFSWNTTNSQKPRFKFQQFGFVGLPKANPNVSSDYVTETDIESALTSSINTTIGDEFVLLKDLSGNSHGKLSDRNIEKKIWQKMISNPRSLSETSLQEIVPNYPNIIGMRNSTALINYYRRSPYLYTLDDFYFNTPQGLNCLLNGDIKYIWETGEEFYCPGVVELYPDSEYPYMYNNYNPYLDKQNLIYNNSVQYISQSPSIERSFGGICNSRRFFYQDPVSPNTDPTDLNAFYTSQAKNEGIDFDEDSNNDIALNSTPGSDGVWEVKIPVISNIGSDPFQSCPFYDPNDHGIDISSPVSSNTIHKIDHKYTIIGFVNMNIFDTDIGSSPPEYNYDILDRIDINRDFCNAPTDTFLVGDVPYQEYYCSDPTYIARDPLSADPVHIANNPTAFFGKDFIGTRAQLLASGFPFQDGEYYHVRQDWPPVPFGFVDDNTIDLPAETGKTIYEYLNEAPYHMNPNKLINDFPNYGTDCNLVRAKVNCDDNFIPSSVNSPSLDGARIPILVK